MKMNIIKSASFLLVVFSILLSLFACGDSSNETIENKEDEVERLEITDWSLDFWLLDKFDKEYFEGRNSSNPYVGGSAYLDDAYEFTVNEKGQKVNPEHYVEYVFGAYPDVSSRTRGIIRINVTDPDVVMFGVTLKTEMIPAINSLIRNGFTITHVSDGGVRAKCGSYYLNFYFNDEIQLYIIQTNKNGIVF
jgi:hypothetical protein